MEVALSSVDDRLALAADGASNRHPVDVDVLGKILPLTLKLDLSDDNMNFGVASTSNHTVTMQVVIPDPVTPGLYWSLMGSNALLDATIDVLGATSRNPLVNIGGSMTPLDTRIKAYGDVSLLSSTLQVESAAPARFGVDVAIIGADNNRDVNVTVDNTVVSALSLEVTVIGAQGPRSQLVSVQGTFGERTLGVQLKGTTPLQISLLSRDDQLTFLSNTSHSHTPRTRSSASPDLTVAVMGIITPLDFTFGLENGDDLTLGIFANTNHSLSVAVAVPSQTTPGLLYLLSGENTYVDYSLAVQHAYTRNALFTVGGSVMPIDTVLHVYGDISSLNSTHTVFTDTDAIGLFGLDLGIDGPADGGRNVNVTVDSAAPVSTSLAVTVIGQSTQVISVSGTMDERTLNVNVNGITPMLVSVVSRDSSLAINTDSDSYSVDRDVILGVAAEILPMSLDMTVTGDAVDLALSGSGASTSTTNVTFVSSDAARALSSVLFSEGSSLDIAVNVAAATSGSPTVSISGGLTTQRGSLNVTGGGVSQLTIALDVLGDASVRSAFDLALAPLAATNRVFTVQSQPITATTDSHQFLALQLGLVAQKTFDLQLVDASNTLFMDTDTVVPTVFVGGSAMMLINNTDEHSSILFPGRRLVPDWPRDAFRPMLNDLGNDCLQPEPDCTREGWIRTAVTDTATCPNRTCTRTGVVLTTPFDVQCPAFGKFPREEYTVLVNPTDAPVKSPYSKWTFYFVVVVLAFCWLVPIAIWTVFGYLYWHLWAEFVVCAMILFAQPHTHPLALSLIQNFNYGVSTAFLFNCWDLHNLSVVSWTGIAACAAIIALWTIEKLGNPKYKLVMKGVLIGQRFFGGWLFFFFAPIGLANIWTAGVAIGTRLFFPLALVALHVLHRLLVRLTRKDKALHPTLLVTIPVAAFAPLVLVGWSFGLGSADVSFSIALASVLVINLPHFIKSWFWKQTDAPQWPWVPAVTIANVIFGLVWVALVYARGPSAAVITFLLLWAVTAVAGTVVGRVMAYLNPKGHRVHALARTSENMRSPLLKDADPSL